VLEKEKERIKEEGRREEERILRALEEQR